MSQASPDSFTYFLFVYFVLNLLTIAVFGWDKLCAMMGRPRIRQRTLFILMATGGSLGGWIAMELFHHKTQKAKFRMVTIAIMLIQFAAVWGSNAYTAHH